MLRTFRIIVLLSMVIQQLVIPAHIARAADPDPNASDVIDALKIVATRLDDLGDFEELGEAIPLTELSPSAEDALRLGTLFTESLWARLNSLAPNISLEELAMQIDTIDGTYNGVVVTISGPDPANDADPVIVNRTGDLIDIQFEVEATRSDPIDLMFDAEAVTLDDGTLSPSLALATVLQFQLDTTALPVLGQAFYLTAAPTVSVSAEATNISFGPITALLGFAEASASGDVTFNLQIDVPFEDPDGLAPLTLHELTSSALEDLLNNMAIVDDAGTDAVSATFAFDTTLIPSNPGESDGAITYVDPDLSTDGDETLDLSGLGNLDDLRNFTAADALGALDRLVTWLNGLQSTGRLDVELPLLGGSFSDALIVAEKLGTATAALKTGEAQKPTFDDAIEMGQDLATALGLPAGVEIIPSYNFDVTPKTLTFQLAFGDSSSASVPLDFRGELDVLSDINISTGGTANLDAAYELGFTFGLDLTPQPTEDGAGIGSCEDGLDNGAGGDGIDAVDPDCATLQTLEQRVFWDVGTTAGSPELVARLGLAASGVDAFAKVGILEAGIQNADLTIGSNQGEDGAGAGTCSDGIDNGDADGADAADTDCNFVTIDFTDSVDGRLTVEDLFNVIGISPPTGATVAFDLSAKIDSTIPVVAELSGTPLGGGNITVSGTYDGPVADSLELVNNITIDGSDLATSELFNFSPCSNNEDDDGDGVVNDGCPQPGSPEAVNDPETESIGLMDKILILLQLLSDQLDAMEGQDIGSSLSDPLPLVGSSFKDLFSYADGLQDLVDDLVQQVQPVAEEPAQCGNGMDDDHDGVIDDGCPIVNSVPETGAQCLNDTDDEDNDPETDGVQKDGVVNDGCPRTAPTLQALESLVEERMEHVLESIPGADADETSATLDISYDNAADDVIFELGAQVGLMAGSTFNLDLSELGGDLVGVDLVALEATGDLGVQVNANMDLDFGLSLNDFSPFMLGSSAFNIAGQADADDLFFEASIGPLMASVGTQTPQAETACNDQIDDDFDGKINDGCAPQGAPETGDQCTGDNDGVDNDGDGIPDDGCGGEGDPGTDTEPETGDQCSDDQDNDGDGYTNDGCYFPDGFADSGRIHLGASFGVTLDGADADKIGLDALSFSGNFDGVAQGSKCPTGADHACAVLPIYFEGVPLGTEPGHQLTLEITDITDPFGAGNFSMTYPDLSELENLIASQLLDMLLLESGLGRFLDVLGSILNGEIFGFDFPLIGDQLDEAANFITTLDEQLVTNVQAGGDPFGGLGLTPSAEDVQNALAPFATAIGTELDSTGLLFDTNNDGTPDEFDFVVTLFCDGEAGCGIGPETGDQCNNSEDDDGDGKVNDGCEAVNVAESGPQCENNTDDEDDDPGTSGVQKDGVVNDGCYPGGYTPPATDVDEVRFYAKLGDSADILDADTSFDIGIPGLGLSSSGKVEGEASWSMDLGFGVNKDQGFFILTQEAVGPPETGDQCTNNYSDDDEDGVPNDGCPELLVGGDVTLPDTLEAQLGFLQVNVVNGDPTDSCGTVGSSTDTPCRPSGDELDDPSLFSSAFTINLQDPAPAASDDGRFSFAEMTKAPKFKDTIAYDLEANADVNLHIETSIEGDAALPKLIGDLKLDWRWSLQGASDADALDDDSGPNSILNNPCDDGESNCFSIVMEDVVLDAGTFLSKLIKPVVEDAQEYTKPLQPVIDVLEAPIPVLTDLSGETVSLLTLCEELCPPEYAQLDMLIAIIKLVSFFNGIDASPGSGDLTIPILTEPLVLNGPRLQSGLLPASESRSAFLTNIDGLGSLVDSLGATAKPGGKLSNGEVQNTSGLKSIGLSFPFLEQPSQLLMMLFGQDADLVLWEPPGLQASFSYSQKFGPIWAVPPVFLEIGGSISINGRLGIGYDTQGLREVLFEGAGAASLLNGLFLTDRNAQGEDVPELELRGELFANAQVSVVIFSAGAGGSVYLTIAIDLVDPDQNGKLKFNEVKEIIETTANPFCLFSLEGKFGVRIFVFAEVDLFIWSERWEKTLADIVLLSFSVQCTFDKVPVLASESSPGELLLHMGPNSDLRGAGSAGINATSEEFTVIQEGDGSLTVTAFGYSENKPAPVGGWQKVVADAGDAVADPEDDEDVISLVDGAVGAETTCANGDAVDDDGDGFINDGCPALDQIEEGAQCVEGDAVDDDNDGLINDGCPIVGDPVPFTIPAELKGGPGNDEITGGLGNDKIDGGDHDDTLVGRGGNDQIIGGKGSDGISAGPGADQIYGDTSATTWISWNSCGDNAPETGGDGNDEVEAGLGADKVCGQGGEDTLIGGISTTPAVGPAEAGGQCGNDVDDDGDGVIDDGCQDVADEIHGGSGGDNIEGGDGGDTLNGDGGEDNISGSNGDDTIDGGNETSPDGDLLIGGPGSDNITGGDGDDTIIGGNALAGEPDQGDAQLDGEGGADTILGDNATFNADGYVLVDPDIGGADMMNGGAGDDEMRGQKGDDDMFGGDDDDDMDGNDGEDFMFGDDGAINNRATADVTVTQDANDGIDDMRGSDGNDHMYGGGAGDFMYGDAGTDFMQGNDGGDTMRGGQQNDEMYGNDGSDLMHGDSGDDRMFGGSYGSGADAGDEMYGNAGFDVMVGDNGMITGAAPEVIQTSDPNNGGDDEMYGDGNDDIMLGGAGGDDIWGLRGADIIVGDNGYVNREAGAVQRIVTNDPCQGGVDEIWGNEEPDIILGGNDGDFIEGNGADDTILGDNGTVVLAPDAVDGTDIFTSDPDCGGSDTISGNAGNDIILGGSGGTDLGEGNTGDNVTGDDGEDIVLGDNGQVTRTEAYEVHRIATTYADRGADDILHGNADKDILLGGMAADDITGDDADDTILGDNGVVVRADGSPEANDVYSTDPTHGGSDTIAGNAGNDIILGGSGGSDSLGTGFGDTINGNTEQDIILGDNGYLTRNAADVVEDGRTTDPTYGGQDIINGDEQDDIVLGGQDGDTLYGNAEDDYILGDNGAFDNRANDADLSTLDVIASTDPNAGGGDIIRGGDGMDIAFGGTASDDIEGNQQHDVLLGDHGLWDSARPANQRFLAIFTGTGDGGDRDLIHGNEGDDFILGQQGDDELYGDADQDDMTGGHNVAGGADGDDDMYGDLSGLDREGDGTFDGAGADVMLGDNGKITRTLLDSNNPVSWQENTLNGTYARDVELFDVERVDGADVSPDVYGDDDMWGNHNDDIMYGQNGQDNMHGGAGDDYMEGNADSDYMEGDGEDDDMLGGSALTSTADPTSLCTGCTDESTMTRIVPFGANAGDTVEVPLGDTMFGDAGSDVMLGDNGKITRPVVDGQWITLEYNPLNDTDGYAEEPPRHTASDSLATRIHREVLNVDLSPGRTAGSDYMEGGDGDDDMYGQFDDTDGPVQPAIGDELLGNGGEDAMLGDNGVVENWVVDTPTQIIAPNEPFIDDDIFVLNTLFRQVTLEQIDIGGNDRMLGGDNGDWMHGGAGNDLMNGNSGNDRLFGDDGEDAAWGGPHHDHLWGGYGNDYLDIKPRPEMTVTQGNDEIVVPPDPAEWFAYAEVDNYQDVDYIYGGWDQDAMQADVADYGPAVGDRLIDWVGAYNVYYLCPALYGEYVITRDLSPAMIKFLQDLAEGDGAFDPSTGDTSGFNEVAIVFPKEARFNAHPIHPDTPGHFTCAD